MGDLKENCLEKKCLESKRVRYSRNFNYKTYGNLNISPLIVITITTFSVYLLQLITNSDSVIHIKKFLSSNFVTNMNKHHIWHLLV